MLVVMKLMIVNVLLGGADDPENGEISVKIGGV